MSHRPAFQRRQIPGFAGLMVVLFGGVLLTVALLAWPSQASAHATLLSTSPEDGSHLDTGPSQIVFTLDEPVSVVQDSPQVIDRDGNRYTIAGSELDERRTVLTVNLATPLPDGSFLATARLLSIDTHVVSVSAAFTVGEAEGLLSAPETEASSLADRIAVFVAKLAVYLGAVLSAGVVLTTGWLWPERRSERRWRTTVSTGSTLLIAGLLLRLIIEAGNRAGGVTRISAETAQSLLTVNPAFGLSALAALLAAILLLSVRLRSLRRLRILGVTATVLVAVAVAYGGHGADPSLFPIPLALTLLHVYAVLAWLGGVAVIAVERSSIDSAARLAGWHRYALAHAALVAVSGAGLAVVRVPAFDALIATTYGLALLGKIALVLSLLAVAAFLYRRLSNLESRTRGRSLLRAELLLVAGVFSLTGVLSSVAPAKVSYDPAVEIAMDFGGGETLRISIPSTQRGPQTIVVEPSAPSASGEDESSPATLSVDLSSRDANISRLPVAFDDLESGTGWRSRDLVVPVAGSWQVTVRFETRAGPRVASFHYEVR